MREACFDNRAPNAPLSGVAVAASLPGEPATVGGGL